MDSKRGDLMKDVMDNGEQDKVIRAIFSVLALNYDETSSKKKRNGGITKGIRPIGYASTGWSFWIRVLTYQPSVERNLSHR
jgi:hypothetical protein